MNFALSMPTWRELESESVPDGPYTVRRSRLGAVWLVVHQETGQVRANAIGEAAAWAKADDFNRRALLGS